jgi:hypothetical protein
MWFFSSISSYRKRAVIFVVGNAMVRLGFGMRIVLVSVLSVVFSAVIYLFLQELKVSGFFALFVVYSLPVFFCCLLFSGVSDGGGVLLFGLLTGLVSSSLWVVVFVLLSVNGSSDYSLIPLIWVLFWVFFVFAGVAGSWISAFVRGHFVEVG